MCEGGKKNIRQLNLPKINKIIQTSHVKKINLSQLNLSTPLQSQTRLKQLSSSSRMPTSQFLECLLQCTLSCSVVSQLFNLMNCNSRSSVHGILQARILEWVAISSSRGSSQPRDRPASHASPALAGGFFTTQSPGKPLYSRQSPK